MRLAPSHGEPGVEIFVYGEAGGPFPARQSLEAAKAVARTHGLDPDRTLFLAQSEEAIAAGAFHNDVVAVANERLLLAHESAFAEPERLTGWITERAPWAEVLVGARGGGQHGRCGGLLPLQWTVGAAGGWCPSADRAERG